MKRNQIVESVQVGDIVSIFKRGSIWYANYQVEGKQSRPSLKTKIKKDAIKKATALETQLQEGYLPRRIVKVPLGQLQHEYLAHLESLERAASTISHSKTALNDFLKFAAAKKVQVISQVDLSLMDDFRDELRRLALAKRVANSQENNNYQKTISLKLTVVRSFVLLAMRKRYVQTDPLMGFKIKKVKTPKQPCWDWGEVRQILGAAPRELVPMFTTLAYTGMRIGEAIHLEWPDLDFRNGFIRIQSKLDWKPKTGENRNIPMVNQVRAQVDNLPKSQKWVFARPLVAQTQLPCSARTAARKALQALQKVLKTLHLTGRLHTFRHSFVSHALTSGTAEAIVREWVGHLDPEMIRDYTHIANKISKTQMDDVFGNDPKTN
jgi:integrase